MAGISPAALESGAAVCLHLPSDALRVLTSNEPVDEAGEVAEAEASA